MISAIVALALWASAGGQSVPAAGIARPNAACDGDSITAIDIHAYPATIGPLEGMSHATSQSVRSWFATTRPDLVRAYLRVRVGEKCSELLRTESERLLRAQPFIASASVSAIPDGPGRVRLDVDVIDELPVIADGALRGGLFGSLTLGTLNFLGRGLGIRAQVTRGFAYRNGYGLHVVQYGAFGGPYYVAASAERNLLGESMALEFAAPFLTPLQRTAFRAGAREASEYLSVVRPEGPDVALHTRRVAYDAGWVTRIGLLDKHHTAGFAGLAVLGEAIRIDDAASIVSDSGLVAAPEAVFGRVYPDFAAVRVAVIAGLRSIHFMTVRGFDALNAQQDVGVGVQVHLLGGPSVWTGLNRGEAFAAADLYAGAGNEQSFVSAYVVSEGRGDYNSPVWDGVVTSARLSWYKRPSERRLRLVSVNLAAIRLIDFPAQLTFRDADGGVAGYGAARAAGGQRAVVRIEERVRIGLLRSRGDLAVAAFADAGKLWSGDVPYGQTTPVRASLGLSLLGAYPSRGKRTYRVDVAFPLNPEPGGAKIELRLSALDRTRLLWLEPRDVSRLRTAAVPTNLTQW